MNKEFENLIKELYSYIKEQLRFKENCKLKLIRDCENSKNILGKTAYYDPNNKEIIIYMSNRHLKDVLRSFSHELIHFYQDIQGRLDKDMKTEQGYAQNDKYLRELEKEAYLSGNMLFRDFEDAKKQTNYIKEEKKNMLKENKPYEFMTERNNRLANRLFELQGIVLNEDDPDQIAKEIEKSLENDLDNAMKDPSISSEEKSEILKSLRKDENLEENLPSLGSTDVDKSLRRQEKKKQKQRKLSQQQLTKIREIVTKYLI